MKKSIYLLMVSFVVVFAIGQILKNTFKDYGIERISSYEDIVNLDSDLDYIFGEDATDEEFIYNSLKDYEQDYINDTLISDIIIVGTSNGKYKQFGKAFCQEVTVKEVIRGSNIEKNDIVNIVGTDGFEVDKDHRIVYRNIQNIMKKDSEYLIFLNHIETEKYQNDNKSFQLQGGYFCYLKLSDGVDPPIKFDQDRIKFNTLNNFEYFATSERILKQISVIKSKIIDSVMGSMNSLVNTY